jgi:hypothetical protein
MGAFIRLNPSSARKGTERNYRKPPEASQFKPGQSGNPNGRPRGSQNFETDLQQMLRAPVEIESADGSRQSRSGKKRRRRCFAKRIQSSQNPSTYVASYSDRPSVSRRRGIGRGFIACSFDARHITATAAALVSP